MVDNEGKCYGTLSFKTRDFVVFDDYIDRLCQDINNLKKVAKIEYELAGIGIGAPNANYFTGNIENPANLHWKDKAGNDLTIIPFVEMVKRHFPSTPVAMTNDANAAAIGEMVFGNARGMKDFAMITLGTGLGSGIVCNGEMVYGHDGFAGEYGHIAVDSRETGRQCGCGRRGCLEAYVSATGIKRTAFDLMASMTCDSELRSIPYDKFEAKMLSDAAAKNDPIALEAFERTGKILGLALADLTAVTAPEAIILFGGLANAGELLLEPIRKHMNNNVVFLWRDKVKVLKSSLPGADAAVLGASALGWKD